MLLAAILGAVLHFGVGGWNGKVIRVWFVGRVLRPYRWLLAALFLYSIYRLIVVPGGSWALTSQFAAAGEEFTRDVAGVSNVPRLTGSSGVFSRTQIWYDIIVFGLGWLFSDAAYSGAKQHIARATSSSTLSPASG